MQANSITQGQGLPCKQTKSMMTNGDVLVFLMLLLFIVDLSQPATVRWLSYLLPFLFARSP